MPYIRKYYPINFLFSEPHNYTLSSLAHVLDWSRQRVLACKKKKGVYKKEHLHLIRLRLGVDLETTTPTLHASRSPNKPRIKINPPDEPVSEFSQSIKERISQVLSTEGTKSSDTDSQRGTDQIP